MIRGLILILACVLAMPARAAPGPVVVIRDNMGGHVLSAIGRRAELEAAGVPVRIEGVCDSACTLFTTLPNACLHPKARIGFHAPRIAGTRIVAPLVPELMAGFYRAGIRERWVRDWSRSLKIRRISAPEYVRLDPAARLCR